ncbi:NAD(P)H-dependent oxidoreductase [Pseudoalteromonas xiamenensis]|uniref:FMN-dependent NADH-azoreductase n=1 Tax=Pseudoalteromonas xiamenensis TaxID=882626 RepID=UPI0027E3FE76|nr:NAD(P)H-dependent oxidoreductase [Pseudoalteromonas xiamenensis]WMN60141.1 NAD(P)H-dependent oxidoreductase [Pseudoalteromonas xiamenensis]
MKKILAIKSSINGANSISNKLIDEVLSLNDNSNTTVRDLGASPLPHLSQHEMGAWMAAVDQITPEQRELKAISDEVVEEVKAADIILIGLPMYNFAVPSNFKSWIDRLARAGVTFNYTENGPVGLLDDKPVYVIATRGGKYHGTPMDSQTQFIKDVFAFVGLKNVNFVYVEGLAMGEADIAIANAQSALSNAL